MVVKTSNGLKGIKEAIDGLNDVFIEDKVTVITRPVKNNDEDFFDINQ